MSVLFADQVGFTTYAEGRDAEEVRELKTRYFDTVREIVGRHGGLAVRRSATGARARAPLLNPFWDGLLRPTRA